MNTVNTCEHSEHSVEHSVNILYTHTQWNTHTMEHSMKSVKIHVTYYIIYTHTMYEEKNTVWNIMWKLHTMHIQCMNKEA